MSHGSRLSPCVWVSFTGSVMDWLLGKIEQQYSASAPHVSKSATIRSMRVINAVSILWGVVTWWLTKFAFELAHLQQSCSHVRQSSIKKSPPSGEECENTFLVAISGQTQSSLAQVRHFKGCKHKKMFCLNCLEEESAVFVRELGSKLA